MTLVESFKNGLWVHSPAALGIAPDVNFYRVVAGRYALSDLNATYLAANRGVEIGVGAIPADFTSAAAGLTVTMRTQSAGGVGPANGGDLTILTGNPTGAGRRGSFNVTGAGAGLRTTFIGTAAGGLSTGVDCTFLGDSAGRDAVAATSCTYIGSQAGLTATGASNTAVGAGASIEVARTTSIAIGAAAACAGGNLNTVVAYNSTATGTGNVLIGPNALVTGSNNVAIGASTNVAVSDSVAIGVQTSTAAASIVLGRGATTSTANTAVLGSNGYPINILYGGKGEMNVAPTAWAVSGTGGTLVNGQAGADLLLTGGPGTGIGVGGSVIIQTALAGLAGIAWNPQLTRITVAQDGGTTWTGITTVMSPAVSPANSGTIFYDRTLQKFRASQNGGAYVDMISSGTVGPGTVNRVAKFTAATVVGDSGITDNGTTVSIATTEFISSPRAGANNEIFGAGAGAALAAGGDRNSALGRNALAACVTADDNVAVGYNALTLATGGLNTAVGSQAGAAQLGSVQSTFIGALAGFTTNHDDDVFVGYRAGYNYNNSTQTVLVGSQAAGNSASGNVTDSVIIGFKAGYIAVSSNHVLVGSQAGISMTNPFPCVAIGKTALYSNVSGGYCVAVGMNALYSSTGASNTAVGYAAGDTIVAGTNTICIGANSDVSAAGNTYAVAVGDAAIVHTQSIVIGASAVSTASNQFVAGSGSYPATTVYFGQGVQNVAPAAYTIHGTNATAASGANGGNVELTPGAGDGVGVAGVVKVNGKLTVTGGIDPTYLELAGLAATTYLNMTDGNAVPVSAGTQGRLRYVTGTGFQISVDGAAYATIATGGGTVGPGTVNRVAKFTAATVVGDSGITDNGTTVSIATTEFISSPRAGANNEIFGAGAGAALAAGGDRNSALGGSALVSCVTGDDNVAVGYNALTLCTGVSNTAVGSGAGALTVAGTDCVAIGYNAQPGAAISSVVAIGSGASVTGSASVVIGRGATTSTANTMVCGSVSYPINILYGGMGEKAAPAISAFMISGTGPRDGTDANGAGGDLHLRGGLGTGTGICGDIDFWFSRVVGAGSGAQTGECVWAMRGHTTPGIYEPAVNTNNGAVMYMRTQRGGSVGNTTGGDLIFQMGSPGTAPSTGRRGYFNVTGVTGAARTTFIGENSGGFCSGTDNVFYGYNCGAGVTSGVRNTIAGAGAGAAAIGAASDNTFFGYTAGAANATGQSTFFGSYSGATSTGSNNTGVGYQTLRNIAAGFNCTAVGHNSLVSTAGVRDNTAVGTSAGQVFTGNYGTFIGSLAGNSVTGSDNTILGAVSAGTLTTGQSNLICGRAANVTAGGTNEAVILGGTASGPTRSVAVGYNVAINSGAAAGTICIGYNSTCATGALSTIVLGSSVTGTEGAIQIGAGAASNGAGGICIGRSSRASAITIGHGSCGSLIGIFNIVIGSSCVTSGVSGTASRNTIVGETSAAAMIEPATRNTAIGYNTINTLTIGEYNSLFGAEANVAAAATSSTVILGAGASAGTASIAIGRSASAAASNIFVAGSGSYQITDVYFGRGVANDTSTPVTIHGTRAVSAATAGSNLILAAGEGNTTGAGGSLIFKVAPNTPAATPNALQAVVTINQYGNHTWAQQAANGATPVFLTLTGAANTANVLSTEANDVYLNLNRTVQFATGALALQRAVLIVPPTYAFVGASVLTEADTFSITSAPVQGANATITKSWALTVNSGGHTVGAPGIAKFSATASTGLTASTEINDVLFDLSASRTWATGNIGFQAAFRIKPPTYLITAGVGQTFTDVATMYIDSAPINGGGGTVFTNSYSLWVNTGKALFGDVLATRTSVNVETANTAACVLQSISEEVTILNAATTDSATNLLPANSFIVGVTARVTVVLPGAVTWQAGTTGSTSLFMAAGTSGAAGTQATSYAHTVASLAPFINQAAAVIRITPSGLPGAATGKIRFTVFYYTLTAPGS